MKTPTLLLLLACLCTGCTHYYYAPNMHNVPLFHDKQEVRIAAAVSTGDEISGTELQTAYSLTNHIGIMANFMSVNGGNVENGGEGHQFEAGAGYFLPFAENGLFELYTGFAGGKVTNTYAPGSYSSMKMNKYFLQPAIGYSTDYFDVAVSVRVAYLHYSSLDLQLAPGTSPDEGLLYVMGNQNLLMYEPAITLRGGWKYIKLQTQWGWSFNSAGQSNFQEPYNFNLGFYFSFARRFEDAKKKRK